MLRRMRFVVVVLMAGACGGGVTSPAAPATATATLSSTATDGAILLRVTGPGFDNAPVAANEGLLLYSRQVSESEWMVAVFGNVADGALFTVGVPDGRKISSYAASVVQVADRGNDLRIALAGYSVVLTVSGPSSGE